MAVAQSAPTRQHVASKTAKCGDPGGQETVEREQQKEASSASCGQNEVVVGRIDGTQGDHLYSTRLTTQHGGSNAGEKGGDASTEIRWGSVYYICCLFEPNSSFASRAAATAFTRTQASSV